MCRAALSLTLLAVLVVFAAGCQRRGPSPNVEGAARDVLVVASGIDAISLDPAVAYEFSSTALCMSFYDTLIRYENSDYTKPLPSLAARWKVSRDGLVYTFYLRPGLRFASGRPLDAAAVRDSLVRTLRMNMAPAELLADNIAPERIRVVDPSTLEIRLAHPSAYFLSTLFNPAAGVVDSKEALAHEVEGDMGSGWLREHSAGSGPFTLKSWERDIAVVMERNENYWGTPPRLRRVIVKDVKESTTQKMMIERGDVDVAYDMNPLQIEDAVARSGRVRALEVPFLRLYYLGMNVKFGPLSDVRVRQAIRAAIRYDDLLAMGSGRQLRLRGPIIKGLVGFDPRLPGDYDPDRARALLATAGYKDGFDVELAVSGGPTVFGPTREDICAKLQSDLAAVGIRVRIKTMSSTAYLELYRGKKTQLNMGDWGADYPDPHNFAHPFGHSKGSLTQRVQYANLRLDPLIDKAGRELSPARRAKLYAVIQRHLMMGGPWATLLQPTRLLPVRVEVQGFRYDAQDPMDYRTVYKEPQ
ncbi:MAG: ABC transporter substrate-binding protein [Armatimonadetes bacterium]|nr:ABC transporter substrate-binding protein [Armatimonadota bacterium]